MQTAASRTVGFDQPTWNWPPGSPRSVLEKVKGGYCLLSIPFFGTAQGVQRLFGFHQVIEIYKPASQRRYGYYCLPVLAGDRLVARVDLKAYRNRGTLKVLSRQLEAPLPAGFGRDLAKQATLSALDGYAKTLGLRPHDITVGN